MTEEIQQKEEDKEIQKLEHELKEEELKNKIHTLKSKTVEIWVKEIKSIILLLIFVVGSIVNVINYILGLIGKKSLATIPSSLSEMANSGVGVGGGGGNIGGSNRMAIMDREHVDMVMSMSIPEPSENFISVFLDIIQNPIVIQFVLFAVLIPIVMDWMKKQKLLKGSDSDASSK